MRKLNYILLVLLAIIAIACASSGSDDKTPPEISDVRVFVRDTLKFMGSAGKEVLVQLSDSTKGLVPDGEEFLIIGKPISFKGRFTDDEGLSSAYLHIWGDTVRNPPYDEVTDTCYHVRRLLPIYMNGQKERVVDSLGMKIIDRVDSVYNRRGSTANSNLQIKVRYSGQGTEDIYKFSVHCVDLAGNEDKENFKKMPLTLLTRQQAIDKLKELGY